MHTNSPALYGSIIHFCFCNFLTLSLQHLVLSVNYKYLLCHFKFVLRDFLIWSYKSPKKDLSHRRLFHFHQINGHNTNTWLQGRKCFRPGGTMFHLPFSDEFVCLWLSHLAFAMSYMLSWHIIHFLLVWIQRDCLFNKRLF